MNMEKLKRSCGVIGLALLVLGMILGMTGESSMYVVLMLLGVILITFSLYTSTYQLTGKGNGMDEESFRR